MKKILIIIIAVVAASIVILLIYFYNSLERKDTNIVFSPKYDEKIYFHKLSWGNDEMLAVSLNKSISVSWAKVENYTLGCGCCILYGLINDTLFLYGNNIAIPKNNKFKTPIKVIFLGNSDSLYKTYKSEGLEMFPPEDKK